MAPPVGWTGADGFAQHGGEFHPADRAGGPDLPPQPASGRTARRWHYAGPGQRSAARHHEGGGTQDRHGALGEPVCHVAQCKDQPTAGSRRRRRADREEARAAAPHREQNGMSGTMPRQWMHRTRRVVESSGSSCRTATCHRESQRQQGENGDHQTDRRFQPAGLLTASMVYRAV